MRIGFGWQSSLAIQLALAGAAIATGSACQAQTTPSQSTASQSTAQNLHEAVEIAVRLSPEAASLPALRDQASALNRAGRGPFSGPPVAAADVLTRSSGLIEQEGSVSVGLRWPGERSAVRAWADGTSAAADAGFDAAGLRIAGEVRAAWWALASARAMVSLNRNQLAIAEITAKQVSRLVDAGEQSQRDLLLAQGDASAAEIRLGQAESELARAEAVFMAMSGPPPADMPPEILATASDIEANPALRAAIARATAADARARALDYEARGRLEAQVGARREQIGLNQGSATALLVGIRVPLGQNQIGVADAAAARSQALTANAESARLRARLIAEQVAARRRVELARSALQSADARRTALAQSFQLTEKGQREGEIGLIETLRARQSLSEAERDFATAQIANAAAISAYNQAMGVLP